MYISSVKYFNKQLKRQIANQKQFPSDDILNRFIMTQAAATLMKSWNRPAALHCLIVTQAAATLTKCWNRPAALHRFIITQAATTMAKNLNRPSRLHQLDKKTSTDLHQCWSLNLFTLFFVPNRLYAHDVKQESKDRHTDNQAPGTKQLFTDQQHDERIKDRQFRATGHKLGIQDV